MQPINCIITEHGDPSVGLFDRVWRIPTPFLTDEIGEYTKDELDFFRGSIRSAYSEFSDDVCSVEYDFELYDYV